MPTLASTFALAAALLAAAPHDLSPSSASAAAHARIEADVWGRLESAPTAPEQDQAGPPPPATVLTGRYAQPPREPPFATAPDTDAIRARCLEGETAEGEAVTACMSRIQQVEHARVSRLNRLAGLCRNNPRLPNETIEACVARRERAEAATSAAVVPLPPQLPVAEPWAEPRETCRRETRAGEGSASISFTCTTGGDERTREAAREMMDRLMGPR